MALTQILDTIVEEEAVNTLKTAFAPLSKFTKDFNTTEKESVTFKVVSAGGTTQDNSSGAITNYQTGAGSTGAPVIVNLTQYSHPFVITPSDKQNGWKMKDLVKTNAVAFANKINKVILAQLPASTSATAVGAASAFTGKKLIGQTGLVDDESVGAILTPDYFATIIPDSKTSLDLTEGAYGYDLGVYKVKSAVLPASVVGAVFAKDAIAVATALPTVPEDIEYQDVQIEGLDGLTVRICNWSDKASRSEYMSFDLMLGSKVLDADLVKSLKA